MPEFKLPTGRPAVMGILNVTPDSFSDGGSYTRLADAVDAAIRMTGEGADLIDVGGESTRPGSAPVPAEEELRRVLPVVRELVKRGVAVSVDTSKSFVAQVCLQAGAVVVNDVTAFGDPEMAGVCMASGCSVCLMHMQGEPRTMQAAPSYNNVVEEVAEFLSAKAEAAVQQGINRSRVWLDPGIGFGKTVTHNLLLLKNLGKLVELGFPVLVGVSRKSFIGKILDDAPVGQRLEGSLAAQVLAQAAGARVIRAHDVRQTVSAARVAAAILDSESSGFLT